MLRTVQAILFFHVSLGLAVDSPVVETTLGKVLGFTSNSRSGRQYFSFTGIPYANPPVGELRFQSPKEPEPWDGILNATNDGPFCIQYNMYNPEPEVIGEEDCLHLSVFTHNLSSSVPVLFHIHGGGYLAGDKSLSGPQYFMDEDVVVVDINYRLGIMGFLSFEDTVMPGNQGLKDQNLALKWVIRNIASFGGDPNKVTLVGESAGSGSVTHHITSRMSKGLFQGAIAESGTNYNMLSLLPPGLARSRAEKLAILLSCPTEDTTEAVSCLQEKDAKELVAHLENFREWQVDPLLLFQPVLEEDGPEAFVRGPIDSWEPSPVPLLIGTTSAEGLLRTGYFLHYNMDFKWFNDNFENLAPLTFRYFASSSNPEEITNKIRRFYFDNREITESDWINITNVYTDAWFTNGIFTGADKHTGDVYFYYFDYLGEYSLGPKNRSYSFGATHTDEVIYLWQNKNYMPLRGKDLEISKQLVKIWTDFAKNGKGELPNKDNDWKTWTPQAHNYLDISESGFQIKTGLHEERNEFWNNLNYRDRFE